MLRGVLRGLAWGGAGCVLGALVAQQYGVRLPEAAQAALRDAAAGEAGGGKGSGR